MRNPAECEVANGLGMMGWGVGVSGNSSGSKQHFAARGRGNKTRGGESEIPFSQGMFTMYVPALIIIKQTGMFFLSGHYHRTSAMSYLSPIRTRLVQGHVIPISILFIFYLINIV